MPKNNTWLIVGAVGIGALALITLSSKGKEEEYPFSGSQYAPSISMPSFNIPDIGIPDFSGIFSGIIDTVNTVGANTYGVGAGLISSASTGIGDVGKSIGETVDKVTNSFETSLESLSNITKIPENVPLTIENIWKAILFPAYETHRAGGEMARIHKAVDTAVKNNIQTVSNVFTGAIGGVPTGGASAVILPTASITLPKPKVSYITPTKADFDRAVGIKDPLKPFG